MEPTEEQQAILNWAKREERSLLINALAGAAKTTTLVLLAHALPLRTTLCVAFNKRISEEMKKRMPGHIECMTLNSLGHRAWAKAIGKRPTPDTGKNYELVKAFTEKLKGDDAAYGRAIFASLMRALALAKTVGYIPPKMRTIGHTLVHDREDLYDAIGAAIDDDPDDTFMDWLDILLEKSITEAYSGNIDFDDQIYMSTLFSAPLPKYEVLMVDEAQDLSPLNHYLIERLRPQRLIAVGDPYQSIYAFRGADTYSMGKLKSKFDMHEMTLSVSFRCPVVGVKRAQARVPHFKWWHTAKEGQITQLEDWTPGHVPDGAAILCRTNAPLFSCAIRLIKASRGVHLIGRELGPGLVKILKKLGPQTLTREEVCAAIDTWERTQLGKARESRRGSIQDRAECLRVFAQYGASLAEAIAYAEHLFASAGPIQLMTGHKAKGLEFDVVFHLDPWRIPSKWAREAADAGNDQSLQQELNVRYVIETRFKEQMFLADLERMK